MNNVDEFFAWMPVEVVPEWLSTHHLRLSHLYDGAAIVDFWPTTGRFARVIRGQQIAAGTVGKGSIHDAIKLLQAIDQ